MSLFLLFRIIFTISITSYTPDDNFLVSCGGSENFSTIDGRKWTGDKDPRTFSSVELSDGSKSSVRDNSLINSVPYNNARLSRSKFSYLFHVKTDGQKFIRLYFYPANYGHNFIHSDSVFSVSVGSHTLLNFSYR
ncbi:hypothetical protein QN277_011950 [Acacia crassicarpa]|uniref:Malectin domain-containing protein n=1 Tax=Acacia crassicarpa TaxID=499986 RepID=A0AAE1TD96_9FABA|nr:hypothetical protein QN277_011950 [Acacia crassicarpa]